MAETAAKPALTRSVDRAAKTREGLPLVAELHQRQMKAEFQTGPILSPHGPPDKTTRGLAIGAAVHVAGQTGPHPSWRARSQGPGIEVGLREGTGQRMLEMFDGGTLDVAFALEEAPRLRWSGLSSSVRSSLSR